LTFNLILTQRRKDAKKVIIGKRHEARGSKDRQEARGKRQQKSAKRAARKCLNWGKSGGVNGGIFNLIFSIIFLPLYLPDIWMVTILLFDKIVTKCGGVNEGEIGVLADVSHYYSIGYKRFSMRNSMPGL
jgi:hypothetical protein